MLVAWEDCSQHKNHCSIVWIMDVYQYSSGYRSSSGDEEVADGRKKAAIQCGGCYTRLMD